jgi:hypothetical protein
MQLTPEFLYLFSYSLAILMKIVCFIISYKVVKLGYQLISAGVKGEFKFSSNFIGFKADLASISPGLLFVLLGVMFMVVAVYVTKNVTYQREGPSSTRVETPVPAQKDSSVSPLVPQRDDFKKQFEKKSSTP